jgi:hypothetical protein
MLGPPRPGDYLINQIRREHPGEHAHRDQVRQPTIRLRLPPSDARHSHTRMITIYGWSTNVLESTAVENIYQL